jgi:hypothetical protein
MLSVMGNAYNKRFVFSTHTQSHHHQSRHHCRQHNRQTKMDDDTKAALWQVCEDAVGSFDI